MKLNELFDSVTIQGPVTICVFDENYTNPDLPIAYENLRPLFETYDMDADRYKIDEATAEMEIAYIYPFSYADHNRLMIEVAETED